MSTDTTTLLAAITAVMVATVINGLSLGEPKDVGEQYVYHYSKCVQWNGGAKGVTHCGKSIPAQETRVDTVREGLILNVHSYRVVN